MTLQVRSLKRLGIIGYGTIARTLVTTLADAGMTGLDAISVLCLPERTEAVRADLLRDAAPIARAANAFSDIQAFLDDAPDLVIECAGHDAVARHATATLAQGIETVVVSVGALADAALYDALVQAARLGGTRLIVPAGAVGGIDILAALKCARIARVAYTSRKPPAAWRGTAADGIVDLARLTEPAVFFDGTAREAARLYPKNANVAATIALAGIGFEKTAVRMIADPGIEENIHEYEVVSDASRYTMRIEGTPSPGNAKTSLTTALSLAREVTNRLAPVAI
jgi:aspartate dehydrogenase